MTNPVGGFTKKVTPDLSVDTNAYANGDVVGGAIELEKVFRSAGATAVLQDVFVTDEDEQDAPLEILLFDEEPEQTYTDNGAAPTLAADVSKVVARVSVAAGDYGSVGALAIATVTGLNRTLEALKGATSLWMVIVTSGTPTYTAADHLRVQFGFLQD